MRGLGLMGIGMGLERRMGTHQYCLCVALLLLPALQGRPDQKNGSHENAVF